MELKVPNLGENISESNIIAIHLEKGKEIQKDDIILELETDKATLEIPSPDCGIVKEILVKVGDSIKQGQVVAILEESTSETSKDPLNYCEFHSNQIHRFLKKSFLKASNDGLHRIILSYNQKQQQRFPLLFQKVL